MSTTYVAETHLTTMNCGVCGGVYAIQEVYRKECHSKAKCWTCPYCRCSWGYPGKTEADKLRARLEIAQSRADKLRARLEIARSHADHAAQRAKGLERSNAALRGVNTRTKNRIKNGVCPCCKRSFVDLAAHMKTKHPAYGEE